MNLQEMLKLSSLSGNKKIGLSEERVRAIIPVARQYIAFWREYPDLFVDFLQTGGKEGVETTFKFYFYQRCFLRAAMRHRKVFACFPRGYSKSFLSVLTQMIRCILYPGAKLYSAAGGKSQSAGILSEKIEEICVMIPAFDREIDRRRGKTVIRNDYCKYVFKNGSYIDNMTAGEKSRGKRRQGGIFEECVSIDKDILQQVLIPIANISRRCMDGSKHSEEPLNQSELYIKLFWTNVNILFTLFFLYDIRRVKKCYIIFIKLKTLVNHKIYIGLTNNIERRQKRHFSDLRRNCHDNSFLQKEYNQYGNENFSFEVIYSDNITEQEIGEKEKYYIQLYDSFRNGYNQNEGGNFGPTNGGSHLTQHDIYNILSAVEFMSRPGGCAI